MTLPPTNGKKLTWDPIFPAPFESGWSIFSKLVALNNINLNELRNLIQREDAMGRKLTLLDCTDSSWIDFERFSILLDVDERRLKDGFWDQLGITPKITSRYEVRRCPQCWELGYHCLLFDLSILSSCPWHRCPLTKSCAGCAFPTTFAIRTADGIRNSRFCPRCGTTLRSFTSLISLKRISRYDAAMIIGYCREFIDWWQLVGEKIPARDLILADILHIGSDTLETQKSSAWQIGYVFSDIGDMLSWKFRLSAFDVKHTTWTEVADVSEELGTSRTEQNFRIRDDAGKYYRSLRRHINKKFVQPHRGCRCSLATQKRHESHTLDGNQVCLVSLAFLVWRMSIEGICNIEGLRFHRADNFLLRLMGPGENYNTSLFSHIRWSYFGFFGIWSELATQCGTQNFRVNISGSRCNGYFEWSYSPAYKNSLENRSPTLQQEFHVLYPNASPLIEMAKRRCRERKKRGGDMRDLHQFQKYFSWAWTRYEDSLRYCLFQVRHPNAFIRGQFWNITV